MADIQADRPVFIGIAKYYRDVAGLLTDGAVAVLRDARYDYEIIDVPGVFELPPAMAMVIASQRYAGFVALGCVLRGQTNHFDLICQESTRGLLDLSASHRFPLGFGVLTCEERAQALERASPQRLDRGGAAARACLHMIDFMHKMAGQSAMSS